MPMALEFPLLTHKERGGAIGPLVIPALRDDTLMTVASSFPQRWDQSSDVMDHADRWMSWT